VTTQGGSGTPAEQGGPNNIIIRDMSFYGDSANITDAVLISSSRSRFDNIFGFGAQSCGIRARGIETSTFTHPVVSTTTAFFLGIAGTSTTPSDGLCLDEDPTFGNATTSVTFTDPTMEGLVNGIHFINANNVVITGGSAEFDTGHGILFDSSTGGLQNRNSAIIGIDLEGNGNGGSANGYDILDLGGDNSFINVLSSSNCSAACNNVSLSSSTVGQDYIQGMVFAGTNAITSPLGVGANGIVVNGFNFTGTCTLTGAFQYIIKGVAVYVPYCATHP
jgi:hypothetical protein